MEEEKIHQFLMGLDDDRYSTIRSQILAMDPLPSIEKIFNMVQQEENHRSAMSNREAQPKTMAAFATSHIARPGYMQKERSTCNHCGKFGHSEGSCYELVGYPPGWSMRGGRGRSRGCGGRAGGRAGAGGGRGKEQAFQAHTHSVPEHDGPHASAEPSQSSFTVNGFTAEQVQRILSLIETPKSTHDKLSGQEIWLLDSGASCHMTNMLSMITDVEEINPICVELPNGTNTLAIKKGKVHLDSRLRLKDVLFVPGLNCNLISIAKLVDNDTCTVTFTKRLCVIHDLTTRSQIGVGEPKRGVYYLQQAKPETEQANKVVSYDILHYRLGHPSS